MISAEGSAPGGGEASKIEQHVEPSGVNRLIDCSFEQRSERTCLEANLHDAEEGRALPPQPSPAAGHRLMCQRGGRGPADSARDSILEPPIAEQGTHLLPQLCVSARAYAFGTELGVGRQLLEQSDQAVGIVCPDASAAALTISSTASTAIPSAASRTNCWRCAWFPPISTRRRRVPGLSEAISRDVRRRNSSDL